MTSKLTRSHEEATIGRFRKDPECAAEYLDAILKDGDEAELLQALQRFSKSFGGVAEIAERAAKPTADELAETRVRVGDALAALRRTLGLTNEDCEIFERARDKTPAEPLKFE